MDKLLLLFLIIFILLTGCTGPAENKYPQLLHKADSLAEIAPDSVHRLLQAIEKPELMGDDDFAYWCLISGKIYGRRTDDGKKYLPSLYFKRACRYYDLYGSDKERAFIRLYWGRSYQETGEYDQAMQLYSEALKDAEQAQEYNAAGMICSFMGDLYSIQDYTDKCRAKYIDAIRYFDLVDNLRMKAIVLADLGFEYLYYKEPGDGLRYMLQADSIAANLQDSILMGNVSYNLGVAYSESGDYLHAEQSLLEVLRFTRNKADSISVYYALSNVYISMGDYRKAHGILTLGTDDRTKGGVLYQLYRIAKGELDYKQALLHLEQYQAVIDSVHTEQNKMHVLEIEQKYDLEHAENVKNKAQVAAQRNYIVALVAMVGLLIIAFLYQQMRRRKNRIIDKQRWELDKADRVIAYVSEQLQAEKTVQQKLIETHQKTNRQHSAVLAEQQQRVERLKEELFTAKLDKIKYASPVGKKILKLVEKVTPDAKRLTDADWNILKGLIRTTFPPLEELLWNRLHPLTESELHLGLLTFFNLESKQEAIILDVAPDSIYKQRTRFRQKLSLPDSENLFDYLKAHCMLHDQLYIPAEN